MELLDQPVLNQGTAFTDEHRTACGLHGLLPPHVETLDEQVVPRTRLSAPRTTTGAAHLLVERLDMRRQQPVQAAGQCGARR